MQTLLEILTQYAEENLVLRYLREYAPHIQAARIRLEKLEESLKLPDPDMEELLDQLRTELDTVCTCREQAFLLSGVSIGLELGRL